MLLLPCRRRLPLGVIAITNVAADSITQLIVVEFRSSEPTVLLWLRQAQWTGMGMLLIGVPGEYVRWRRTFDRATGSRITLPADVLADQAVTGEGTRLI